MSTDYARIIAKITGTSLTVNPALMVWLTVNYGDSSGQAIGGIVLDTPVRDDEGKFIRRRGTAYGCEFILRVIKACGVERWEDIEGRTIYVLKKPGTHHIGSSASDSVVGIAPLPTEPGEPFIFADLAAQFDSEGNTK